MLKGLKHVEKCLISFFTRAWWWYNGWQAQFGEKEIEKLDLNYKIETKEKLIKGYKSSNELEQQQKYMVKYNN